MHRAVGWFCGRCRRLRTSRLRPPGACESLAVWATQLAASCPGLPSTSTAPCLRSHFTQALSQVARLRHCPPPTTTQPRPKPRPPASPSHPRLHPHFHPELPLPLSSPADANRPQHAVVIGHIQAAGEGAVCRDAKTDCMCLFSSSVGFVVVFAAWPRQQKICKQQESSLCL
jgi:hypothetical protein